MMDASNSPDGAALRGSVSVSFIPPGASSKVAGTGLTSHRAVRVRHVVVNLDGARLDVGVSLLDGGLHLGGDQRLVVVVERPADAAFGETQDLDARLEGARPWPA